MTRPKRTCAEPGCPTLVTKGYCLRHNRNRRLREKRESSSERTYDHRWQKLCKIVLARDPICKACEEAPSTEVDHIIPRAPTQHAADVTEEELQALCASCHSSKTRAENAPSNWDYSKAQWIAAGGGNPDGGSDAPLPAANDRGERTGEPSPKSKRRRKSKDAKHLGSKGGPKTPEGGKI